LNLKKITVHGAVGSQWENAYELRGIILELVRICVPLKKPIVYWLLDIPLDYTPKDTKNIPAWSRCYSGFQASTTLAT